MKIVNDLQRLQRQIHHTYSLSNRAENDDKAVLVPIRKQLRLADAMISAIRTEVQKHERNCP